MRLAISTNQVLGLSGVAVLTLLAAGVVLALVVKAMLTKVLALALAVGLALALWSQRTELQDCAGRVSSQVAVAGTAASTTCTFFGRDIAVTLPGERSDPVGR